MGLVGCVVVVVQMYGGCGISIVYAYDCGEGNFWLVVVCKPLWRPLWGLLRQWYVCLGGF